MTNELKTKLTEKLKKLPEEAAEFILAQLEELGALGETTAGEIVSGKLDPWGEVWKKAQKQAKDGCAMIDNRTVFGWIAEALHLDGVIPAERIAAFVPSGMAGADSPKAAMPAPVSEIDLDALFD